MDLKFSEQDEAFRDEVRSFLDAELTDEMRTAANRTIETFCDSDVGVKWQKKLYQRGWGAPTWPVEYGGTGWSTVQHYIFAVECEKAGAPKHLNGGPAPCIIDFGTPEQKERFLPRIIRGEERWCQGYSEPQAGSDLAALQTRAISDGDHYVVNGRKIWTTHAHHADWIFCLVRTSTAGKKQEGISFLLIDLKSPGIEIRPIINLAGDHEFNEVVFSDVRVPKANRVGPENEGWTVAKHFLKYEHAGTGGRGAVLRSRLARLRRIASLERAEDGKRLIDDEAFRRSVDGVSIEVEAVDTLELRLMCKVSAGQHLGTEGSFIRIRASEVMQTLTELMMIAMSYYALPFQPELRLMNPDVEPVAPEHGCLATMTYLMKRAETIYGGSVEVHRNIISKRLLGF